MCDKPMTTTVIRGKYIYLASVTDNAGRLANIHIDDDRLRRTSHLPQRAQSHALMCVKKVNILTFKSHYNSNDI